MERPTSSWQVAGKNERSLHVLYIALSRASTSTNQSFRRQVLGLIKQGFRVTLVTTRWSYSSVMQPGLRVIELPMATSGLWSIMRTLPGLGILRKRLGARMLTRKVEDVVPFANDTWWAEWRSLVANAEFTARVAWLSRLVSRGDTVIVWGDERPGAMAGWVVSRILGAPLVTSFQGTVLFPWLTGTGRLRTLMRFPVDYIALSVPADLIVMTNDGTKGNQVLTLLGHPEERILYLPNGVEEEELASVAPLSKEALGLRHTKKLYVVVSRLDPWKRVDRALYLARGLKEGNLDFRLFIAGDGIERPLLEAVAAKLQITGQVKFLGAVSNRDTLRLIASADMLWSFCDHSNLTNSVQEAVALGTPVLTLADGSLDGVLSWPGILTVSVRPDFVEDAVRIIGQNTDLKARLQPGRVPTWRERMERVAEALRGLASRGGRWL